MEFMDTPSIPEFFTGRDIFITGGTGFMGKVLIEKLLRSCPNINQIFMLMRSKKGKEPSDRLKDILALPLFERLRTEFPDNIRKIIVINGDVTQLQLGINDADRKCMENVSIVFHAAASVRFDDAFTKAVIMNTRGTRETLLFAKSLNRLAVFVHVSTTYCNPKKRIVEEHIYPPNGDYRSAIKVAETLDQDMLNCLTEKYTNGEPNTYTFTKGLSEQIINDFKDRIPIIIFRPSIVISSLHEPMPGWIDNFNGPVGLLVACGYGILRTSYADPDNVSDFTPVDICIKAMIVAAWRKGTESVAIQPDDRSVMVYNCSTSLQRRFTNGFIIKMGEELSADIPMDQMLWKPGGHVTRCKYYNFIKLILVQICTAYLVDFIFKLTGQKQFLVKLQRKIYEANLALHYFIQTHWEFKNDNFLKLHTYIKNEDLNDFRYDTFITDDVRDYFINCMLGARRYLLNSKDEDLPKARQTYKKFSVLDRVVKIIIYTTVLYFILKKLGILDFIFNI